MAVMGNGSSAPDPVPAPAAEGAGGTGDGKSEQIAGLIRYARTSYESNPTEALSALLQAMTLNGGRAAADEMTERLRAELGPDVADHVADSSERAERARRVVEGLLADTSTLLYEGGRQDILRQTMEDGSSVACARCGAVVSAERWRQHSSYWCEAIEPLDRGQGEGGGERVEEEMEDL